MCLIMWGKIPWVVIMHSRVLTHKYADYDLIVTGDNHQSFIYNSPHNLLVNPGSLTRR